MNIVTCSSRWVVWVRPGPLSTLVLFLWEVRAFPWCCKLGIYCGACRVGHLYVEPGTEVQYWRGISTCRRIRQEEFESFSFSSSEIEDDSDRVCRDARRALSRGFRLLLLGMYDLLLALYDLLLRYACLVRLVREYHVPYSASSKTWKGINSGLTSTDHLYFHIASLL